MAPLPASGGNAIAPPVVEYRLRFYHTHTHERLDVVYRCGDVYLPEGLSRLDFYLRDYRTGDVHHYDPHVFDLLHELTSSLGRPDAEIEVICGYRTPRTNEFLRSQRFCSRTSPDARSCRAVRSHALVSPHVVSNRGILWSDCMNRCDW